MSTGPTRLPYGLGFVKPNNAFGATSSQYILQTGATPDVSMGTWFTVNFSSNTITNFVGGERGKLLYINCATGGVVILQNSAGGIRFNNILVATSNNQVMTVSSTAGNITMLNGETLEFVHDGTSWSMIGDRVIISTQV